MPPWLLYSCKGLVTASTVAILILMGVNIKNYHQFICKKGTMKVLYIAIAFALVLDAFNIWTDPWLAAYRVFTD
jgi:hypothetical protein